MSRTASSSLRIGLAAALGLAAAVAFSTPAAAHSTIIDSTPADGAELTEAPAEFSVTANEDLADLSGDGEGFALRVVPATGGDDLATGELTIDGPMLSTPGVPLEPGDYVMQYQVVSADGHPISGEIPFVILGAEPDPAPAPEEPGGGEEPPLDILPISAPAGGVPGWLGGAIAFALIIIGGIAAAAAPRRR